MVNPWQRPLSGSPQVLRPLTRPSQLLGGKAFSHSILLALPHHLSLSGEEKAALWKCGQIMIMRLLLAPSVMKWRVFLAISEKVLDKDYISKGEKRNKEMWKKMRDFFTIQE